jgi:hypothetical protein
VNEPLIEDWYEANAPVDLEPDLCPVRELLEWACDAYLMEFLRGIATRACT